MEHNQKSTQKIDIKSNLILIAIIIAALIVAGAIISSRKNVSLTGETKKKTLVEELGINEDEYTACFAEKRHAPKIAQNIESAQRATAHRTDGTGTPYSVAIHKDGTKFEIAGAYPTEAVKGILDGMLLGKTQSQPEINIDPVTETDHYFGSRDADIVVIEYSDLECPYCAKFHQTMHELVTQYNGKVAWVYRHLPLESIHKNAMNKALASECITELGGNDAFWKYTDNLFEKMQPKVPVFDPLTGDTVE